MKIGGGRTPGFPPVRLQANFTSPPLVSQTLGSLSTSFNIFHLFNQ
ncbi:MAG: hypothetical protein HYZ54_04890 [Ignavibacteriae bacterium]|nr:hypothetical protein [Ignavibacteriota bacterium]